MAATAPLSPKLFGLLELDAAGMALYSRIEKDGGAGALSADVTGRNFDTQVATFKNVDEFQHRLDAFWKGAHIANRYDFIFRYTDGPLRARMLPARIRERSQHGTTKSILVHIRQAL